MPNSIHLETGGVLTPQQAKIYFVSEAGSFIKCVRAEVESSWSVIKVSSVREVTYVSRKFSIFWTQHLQEIDELFSV